MRKLLIGNWKSNKTLAEATEWFEYMLKNKEQLDGLKGVKMVIAPPFPLLSFVKYYVDKHALPIGIAAQDISQFDQGAFTGEVNGKLLADFCDYVLVGHAERRKYFHDDEEVLNKKVELAKLYDLEPVYCLHDLEIEVPAGVKYVAYEPLLAIGTGKAMDPSEAAAAVEVIRAKNKGVEVLYGGSVTTENVQEFLQQDCLCGLLVGGASLDPEKFLRMADLFNK